MAIFDIIEEVSKKQIEKTDTGDARIMGIMMGQVVKNYDENMPGRVQVKLLSREQGSGEGDKADQTRLLWARVVMPSSGSIWGHYFIPEIGDLVIVTFEQGFIERAYVIGCIPKTNDQILTKSKDEKNKYKKIVTKNGSSIVFEDITEDKEGDGGQGGQGGQGGGEPGSKDKITISTALGSHYLKFDNEKKEITLADKGDGNKPNNFLKIESDEQKGHITIESKKKVTIKVGDSITVEMNGESGEISVKAKKVMVEADENLKLNSQNGTTLSGKNLEVEGTSMVNIKSNGSTSVQGKPVKVG